MRPTRAVAAAVVLAGAMSMSAAAQQPLARATAPRLLPGTRVASLSTIQGNALSSTNGQLANIAVRLRDARFGRIVDSQLTDRSGMFAFSSVEPGTYIVEMVGTDQSVLAASQVLSVGAGEAVSAVVKLPFRITPFAGILGNTVPSATAVTAAAATSTVLTVTTAGEPTCPIGSVQ